MRGNAIGLPITLDLEGARVVVIGPDDDERRQKQSLLEDAGAAIELLAPDELADDKLAGARLVMVTSREPELVARVAAVVRRSDALLWCSDAPASSDFAMPAIARLGRARVAISTAGAAPALAKRMREQVEAALDTERFRRFVDELAKLRDTLEGLDFDERRRRLTDAIAEFELGLTARYPSWLE